MMALERTKQEGRTSAGRWLLRLAVAAVMAATFIGSGCYARVGPRGHHHGKSGYVHGSSKGSPASPAAKGPKAKKAPPAKGHHKK